MRTYFLRRLLLAVPTLIGISVVTFVLSRMAPGGPLAPRIEGLYAADIPITEENLENTRKLLGLDQPLPEQYWLWLKRTVTLDFGRSMSLDRRPVRDKVLEALKVSFGLQLISVVLIYLVSVPLGAYSAVRHRRRGERVLTIGLLFLYSVPNFLLASILIVLFCTGQFLDWLPMFGLSSLDREDMGLWERIVDSIRHLVLPVLCLSYAGFATLSRYTRSGLLEVIRQDYIRTARAKGLPEFQVIAKHALRNGIIPVVTLLGALFPFLVGGSVIVETIFSIPGMGRLAFDSVIARDYPTIMALSTLVGVATLLGFLVVDVLYVIIDPRVTFRT